MNQHKSVWAKYVPLAQNKKILFMLQANTPWGQSSRTGIMDPDQLYDLRSDPGETTNLANNPVYAEKLKEMKMYLSEFLNDIGSPFSDDFQR